MLGKAVQDAMNEQMKNEFYSGYLYLSMAAYAESKNLPGFAHWMRVQAQEETAHAMKFFDYICERGGRVALEAIDQPQVLFTSPLNLFETTLAHEKKVTGMIHDLYALAVEEKDYASQIFLQWYVSEQVEEEKNASEIVERLKMVGDKGQALVMMDRALAARGD